MVKNFKKYFFLIVILLIPILLIQQWSKRASHFFKDLGYKTQEIATVENEILVKTIDTVKVPSFKFLNMTDSISNYDLLGSNYLIQFFFTACPTICPASTTNIRNEIHKKFQNIDDLKIISTVDSASMLQREVAIANMPEQLRDEMRSRMSLQEEIIEQPSPSLLLWCINNAAEEGIITLQRLQGILHGKGVMVDSEDIAEEGVSQGLLLRQSDGTYLLLQ